LRTVIITPVRYRLDIVCGEIVVGQIIR
jgi:hypothetical protein